VGAASRLTSGLCLETRSARLAACVWKRIPLLVAALEGLHVRSVKISAPPTPTNVRALPSLQPHAAALAKITSGLRELVAASAPIDTGRSRWLRAADSPLPQKTIRALVADGTIPAAKPGKHLLIDCEVHDAWIARFAIAPSDLDAGEDEMLTRFGAEPAPARRAA
jgi:excisionase family DNA binding protein